MQIPVCGSNKKTYPNHCIVYEKAVRQNNPSLKVIWFGNCLSAPWIVTPFENVYERFGKSIALHCVARGIPVPHIIWQFQSANGQKVLNLPSMIHSIIFQLRYVYIQLEMNWNEGLFLIHFQVRSTQL